MIRYSFETLDAHRVESTALSSNPASVNMNDRMIEEGVMRDRYFVSSGGILGTFVDEHRYRPLRSEWNEQLKQKG